MMPARRAPLALTQLAVQRTDPSPVPESAGLASALVDTVERYPHHALLIAATATQSLCFE